MDPKNASKNAPSNEDDKKQPEGTKPEASTSEEETKPTMWGAFKIETGIVPERATDSKYDWASFPAPSNPADPQTWPSVFIAGIGSKTIYNSINKYRDKLQKEGKTAPEFMVSTSKDPKGVRVIRKA